MDEGEGVAKSKVRYKTLCHCIEKWRHFKWRNR
jgi:hypothetical protein